MHYGGLLCYMLALDPTGRVVAAGCVTFDVLDMNLHSMTNLPPRRMQTFQVVARFNMQHKPARQILVELVSEHGSLIVWFPTPHAVDSSGRDDWTTPEYQQFLGFVRGRVFDLSSRCWTEELGQIIPWPLQLCSGSH